MSMEGAGHTSRYDILFEPVQIGPVIAKNRFFQVPHCNGMGYRDPSAEAELRRVKAEGGWSVVCTEQVEIHPTSDITPFIELRIWDEQDFPSLQKICDAIHEGGSLAGIELAHNGMNAPNLASREVPMGPSDLPVAPDSVDPVQARAMTKKDIADLRHWHRLAVRRSLEIGFDVIYVYAAHGYSVIEHFLSPKYNNRTDEYGGSIENRMRLLREILQDTIDEVDGRAAVACRLAVENEHGEGGIGRKDVEAVLRELGEMPDLWDFAMGSWEADSETSRFGPEGGQEQYVAGLKSLTSKPVVGVGRFTSPDAMVRQIKKGILDFIGGARPSIADPFLPKKIQEGRMEAIRECIGCNICVSGDQTMAPIRCTQNPSMGEEWRRGWHPERIRERESDSDILVIGGGPAGLEAARALGVRGYNVILAESRRELGGRVTDEAALPHLSAWIRVRDYRELVIQEELNNVDIFLDNEMTVDDVMEIGYRHILVATGSTWRRDGVGRVHTKPMPIDDSMQVLSPTDLFAGTLPDGKRVLVYDDDYYYMGGVVAEMLADKGYEVAIATPSAQVSPWTEHTFEVDRIQKRLIESGVERLVETSVNRVTSTGAELANVYTGSTRDRAFDAVVMVTARTPNNTLLNSLLERRDQGELDYVRGIGDCYGPGTIAAAVWSGRRAAEEFDAPEVASEKVPYLREVTQVAAG